jgi:hypothetical protein
MTMMLGTDEGFVEPGTPGFSNPFPYENLHAITYRRLAKNRQAGLSNKTVDWEPSQNDIVASHRAVYTTRSGHTRHPRLLAAFNPGAGQALGGAETPVSPRAASASLTDVTGKTLTHAGGSLTRSGPLGLSSASSLYIIPVQANEIFVQWLTMGDTDLANLSKYITRTTDTGNLIQITRQAATNLRVERVVATVAATERDITVPATTPVTGNALGIRLSGTGAAVFLNGTKLDEWTLNAAAQGLTGTNIGMLYTSGNHLFAFLSYFEAWSLAPVLGV